MANTNFTAHRLRELLNYDPATGIFTRKIVTCSRHTVGEVVGSVCANGYLKIMLDRNHYLLHRLAWLYVTGEWPMAVIDHRDGIKSNNRFANLRDVSRSVNGQNQTRAMEDSKSGYLGVHKRTENRIENRKKKWSAIIVVNKKSVFLGDFTDPKEAHEIYLTAKRKLHPGCTI